MSGAEIALRVLTQGSKAETGQVGTLQQFRSAAIDMTPSTAAATSSALAAIHDLASGKPSPSGAAMSSADAVDAVKQWAKSGLFHAAAQGNADDAVRAAVKDGKLPTLPTLDDATYAVLSEPERKIYGVVGVLQGMYDAQPKTLAEALSSHVDAVLQSYPEAIARMQAGVADGTLKEAEGWKGIIADYQQQLDAARSGKMEIHSVDDKAQVREIDEFTVHDDGVGWSGRGLRVEADIPALQAKYGTSHVLPGASPYIGAYVITW
ncbi:MAG: hypothetical protein EKK41_13930 [Hyphomicrobiales bacterium]|nr:MAG: hypothetical protein EKK41_13930 [Hyphomicrobiales bacterium]